VEWVKVFHIVMMVSWFAGLFYLPRLFVNHAACTKDDVSAQLSAMEGRLYRFVTPMMWLTLLSGFVLAWAQWNYLQVAAWFYIKVTTVGFLVWYHFRCGGLVKMFAEKKNRRSHVFYRWFNEAPVLALVVIVSMVIVRPF